MSDESALLAAIIAHPGEDTPRLAYADWLDEHDQPLRAEFIRLQCRLASCSVADPNYPDLLERQAELVAQFDSIANHTVPEMPPGFKFRSNFRNEPQGFRRGFPYTAMAVGWANTIAQVGATDSATNPFNIALSKLIETTTARELYLKGGSANELAHLLTLPSAEPLTGLAITPTSTSVDESTALIRAIANARCGRNLERVVMCFAQVSAQGLEVLARAKFDRIVHFCLPGLSGPVRVLRPLIEAKWFHELRSIEAITSAALLEGAVVSELAKLPNLEALRLDYPSWQAQKALGAAHGFPALTQLKTVYPRGAEPPRTIKATFPQLRELTVQDATNDAILPLLKTDWFSRLRVLGLSSSPVTTQMLSDKTIVALAQSPAAASLRILRLEYVPFGSTGLLALANSSRLMNLTTLSVRPLLRRPTTRDLVKFATRLSLPRIRHLDLSDWPLNDDGAKALAANPSLSNLTRLSLSNCGITGRGLTALVRSPYLQRLIELDITLNQLKSVTALCDKNYLPQLATLHLGNSQVSATERNKLHTVRELVVA